MTRMSTALGAGFQAARLAYSDPARAQGGRTASDRDAAYRTYWGYYDGSAFASLSAWASLKGDQALYRRTRLLYNCTSTLVDFYAAHIYPGVLTTDGKTLPDGVPLAVPLPRDMAPELRAAIAQFWAWSEWSALKTEMVRFGAAVGDVFLELVDDVAGGKVYPKLHWPGHVTDVTLSPAGHLVAYTLSYQVTDELERSYQYTQTVTKERFATFRDGRPFDFSEDGQGAEWENAYGFVPAVWVRHKRVGGNFGAPAIASSVGKINQLNSLGAMAHDQVAKQLGAGVVFWSKGRVSALSERKRGPTEDDASATSGGPDLDRETIPYLQGPEGGRIDSLAAQLNPAAAVPLLELLQAELERSHPEIVYYNKLRSMSQVTGPAANILMGDVANAVAQAAVNYDAASASLFRMAVAMAGERANAGDWGPRLTTQQQKFAPFDLSSYERDELNVEIAPRPLVPPTKRELLELDLLQASVTAAQATPTPATVAETVRVAG